MKRWSRKGALTMSKYTTELRFICETYAGLTESAGYGDVESIIKASRSKIFDFTYPIFDSAYKETLESKIIEHFYTQEIGFETVARWKLALRATMREIMPTYNRLYQDGLSVINPLVPIELTDSYTKSGSSQSDNERTANTSKAMSTGEMQSESGSNSGTVHDLGSTSGTEEREETSEGTTGKVSANKNVRWDKYSETPQGGLSGVENDNYLTSARQITDDGTGSTESVTQESSATGSTTTGTESENTRTITGTDERQRTGSRDSSETGTETGSESGHTQTTEEYVLKRVGRNGADILDIVERMRAALVDVDQMIIADLQPLFMGLW